MRRLTDPDTSGIRPRPDTDHTPRGYTMPVPCPRGGQGHPDDRSDQLWTYGLLNVKSRLRGRTPEEQLLAIFDVVHHWLAQPGNGNFAPIAVLAEICMADNTEAGSAMSAGSIRAMLRERAGAAKMTDPGAVAGSLHVLLVGAVIAGAGGDAQAARRAREVARAVLQEHGAQPC